MTDLTAKSRLLQALCLIDKPDAMESVLRALLTSKELLEIEHRLQIFEMLSAQVPQRDIAQQLGVGIATVTRGAHALREGQFDELAKYIAQSASAVQSV